MNICSYVIHRTTRCQQLFAAAIKQNKGAAIYATVFGHISIFVFEEAANTITRMTITKQTWFRKYLYDDSRIDRSNLLFDNKALSKLLIPLMLEQLLNSFMGMADTVMVSNISSAAISAVSLVDAINVLIIQVFAALATGGTIVCSQYIGRGDNKKANKAAGQVVLIILILSLFITSFGLIFCNPLLKLIFGKVEKDVMQASQRYFFITLFSFPFFSLFQAGSAFFRVGGNSRYPMLISAIGNGVNIAGNYVLIFIFHMGVDGAALATLISRVFCFAVIFISLRKNKQIIVLNSPSLLKPDFQLIKKVLTIGIPSGIENGLFQFGKLAIQSSVSTLTTAAIAAQAMTIIMEALNGIAGLGIGIGLMTVIGQTIGAGRKEEARYYLVKLTGLAFIAVFISCILVYFAAEPITVIAGMEEESKFLCLQMVTVITIAKPVPWTLSFIPAYGLRAAGDVRFSMITGSITMWICRVAICICLIRFFGFGPIAVWIGMITDWAVRAVAFTLRYLSGRWLGKQII